MIREIIKKLKYELEFNNTDYYTRISDKLFKKSYQFLLRKKINSLPPLSLVKEDIKLTLAILANKKNFYESIAALYSFCFWNKNIDIHYHEDGTLTENEFDVLMRVFPGITIFKRSEQNQKITDHLLSKGLVNCAQLRGHFLFSIRSFDMIVEKKTPYLLQIDSDVLFFSKPVEIFEIINKGNVNGCYNKDLHNMYSLDIVSISKYIPVPVIDSFNAGLFMHNFDEGFFDFAEPVIENEPQVKMSWHLEQTLFAMYASYKGNFLELPKTYGLGRAAPAIGNETVSKHYVHNTGYNLHKDFIYKLYPMYSSPNN